MTARVSRTIPQSSIGWRLVAESVGFWLALAVAILSGLFFIGIGAFAPPSSPGDESAYWLAAQRITHGGPLFTQVVTDEEELYRYAPWLAWLWIPLTWLPQSVAYLVWEAFLLACAVYVVATFAKMGGAGVVIAALCLPLVGAVASGNVGTAVIALLVWRRSDPWSVGIAGSLKLYPLLLCAGYVAERRWRDCIIAVGVAAVLWLPVAFYGLSGYPAQGGQAGSLLILPALAVVGIMAWTSTRWTWIAVGLAMPLLPHYVGVSYLWVAARRLRG